MKSLLTFIAGALCGGVLIFFIMSRHTVPVEDPGAKSNAAAPVTPAPAQPAAPPSEAASKSSEPAPPRPAASLSTQPSALTIPVADVDASQLTDTFTQSRSAGRPHEAIDIMAPRGTPVIAVADGKVAKIFESKPGGHTVYQFDVEERLAYYYAHLDGYAPGLTEGQRLKRGELIGFVGSSGNANPASPHLHFAIFELGPEKRWWEGRAINPYPLLAGKENARQ
jgi:peptidoglycan LD-endopeptidase LytH